MRITRPQKDGGHVSCCPASAVGWANLLDLPFKDDAMMRSGTEVARNYLRIWELTVARSRGSGLLPVNSIKRSIMTNPPIMTDKDREAHREHVAWLGDCGRWRSEHRQTLATLAQVQAAVMEQESALESHAAQIQSHDMHLQKYSLTEFEPGDADYELLEQEHADFVQKHEGVRESHERLRKHHSNIRGEVEKLLEMCVSAM
jgi:hypothetical protein